MWHTFHDFKHTTILSLGTANIRFLRIHTTIFGTKNASFAVED